MRVLNFTQLLINRKLFNIWTDPNPHYIVVHHKNILIEHDTFIKDIQNITKEDPLVVEQHHPCKYCDFIHLLLLYFMHLLLYFVHLLYQELTL